MCACVCERATKAIVMATPELHNEMLICAFHNERLLSFNIDHHEKKIVADPPRGLPVRVDCSYDPETGRDREIWWSHPIPNTHSIHMRQD